jgi:hypothetical protein
LRHAPAARATWLGAIGIIRAPSCEAEAKLKQKESSVNKCIQFVLPALLVLCLNWLSAAQTNPQPTTDASSQELQAFNHNPEFVFEAGDVVPDVNSNCWSSVALSSSAPSVLLIEAITLTSKVDMSTNSSRLETSL